MTIFLIDCLTGNWLVITGLDDPKDYEELSGQLILFLAAKGWFVIVPYLMVYYVMLRRIRFDNFDIILNFICILSVIITQWDYYNNGNGRETNLDWWVFITIFLFFLTLKLSWKKLLKIIQKALL